MAEGLLTSLDVRHSTTASYHPQCNSQAEVCNKTMSHMKGLNSMFQKKSVTENIDPIEKPTISYNIMHKSPDFAIYKTYMSKNLFRNYIPIKRYFVYATGSLPLKIN